MSEEQTIAVNGINAVTGDYLHRPTIDEIVAVARGGKLDKEGAQYQDLHYRKTAQYPLKPPLEPGQLPDAGWGIIFARDDPHVPALREALTPLLKLRRSQVGKGEPYFREFLDENGYRPGESKTDFLRRFGAAPGPVDPKDGLPYYLLIVADPLTIPYQFQHQLDVQFAVGRICFGTYQDGAFVHDIEAYARYAKSVATAEIGKIKRPRRVALFGVNNPDDLATQMSTRYLINPLSEAIHQYRLLETIKDQLRRSWTSIQEYTDNIPHINRLADERLAAMSEQERESLKSDPSWWHIETYLQDQAMKEHLGRLLGGDETPLLLFTASHGMEFPNGHERQLAHQGALLCQNWPGPHEWKKLAKQFNLPIVSDDYYFSGDDISEDARLHGMIAFFFACYGAGTPMQDEFYQQAFTSPEAIAPYPFLARLPQRMLTSARGGALAVIGHVERAWGYSFMSADTTRAHTAAFESATNLLMEGQTVGFAVENMNLRYAELATMLTTRIEHLESGGNVDPKELAALWTMQNDARNYMIIGDPAVRLPLNQEGAGGDPTPEKPVELSARATETESAPAAPSAPAGAANKERKPPSRLASAAASAASSTRPTPPAPKQETERASALAEPGPTTVPSFSMGEAEARDVSEHLSAALQQLIRKMGEAVENIASLRVETYTLEPTEGDPNQRSQLNAATEVSFDGDIKSYIPRNEEGEIDQELLQIHREMVDQAQYHRAKMIEMVLKLGSDLFRIRW